MNRLFQITLFIGLSLVLFACPEPEDQFTVIRGNVVNKATGEPIPNVPIKITECLAQLGCLFGCQPQCGIFNTLYTDENGRYELGFIASGDSYYTYELDTYNYFSKEASIYGNGDIKAGLTNEFNFELYPMVTLKVHLVGSDETKNWISISYNRSDSAHNELVGGSLLFLNRNNLVMDTTIYQTVFPESYYEFNKMTCLQSENQEFQDCETITLPKIWIEFQDTTLVDFSF